MSGQGRDLKITGKAVRLQVMPPNKVTAESPPDAMQQEQQQRQQQQQQQQQHGHKSRKRPANSYRNAAESSVEDKGSSDALPPRKKKKQARETPQEVLARAFVALKKSMSLSLHSTGSSSVASKPSSEQQGKMEQKKSQGGLKLDSLFPPCHQRAGYREETSPTNLGTQQQMARSERNLVLPDSQSDSRNASLNEELKDSKFDLRHKLTTPEGQLEVNPNLTMAEAKKAAKAEYNKRNGLRARRRRKILVQELRETIATLKRKRKILSNENERIRIQVMMLEERAQERKKRLAQLQRQKNAQRGVAFIDNASQIGVAGNKSNNSSRPRVQQGFGTSITTPLGLLALLQEMQQNHSASSQPRQPSSVFDNNAASSSRCLETTPADLAVPSAPAQPSRQQNQSRGSLHGTTLHTSNGMNPDMNQALQTLLQQQQNQQSAVGSQKPQELQQTMPTGTILPTPSSPPPPHSSTRSKYPMAQKESNARPPASSAVSTSSATDSDSSLLLGNLMQALLAQRQLKPPPSSSSSSLQAPPQQQQKQEASLQALSSSPPRHSWQQAALAGYQRQQQQGRAEPPMQQVNVIESSPTGKVQSLLQVLANLPRSQQPGGFQDKT